MANIDTSVVGPYTRVDTRHVDPSMRPTKEDYDRYLAIIEFGAAHNWEQAAFASNGPMRVADPTLTFTLLRAHRDLAAIGKTLGQDVSEIEAWADALQSGAETLWNAELGHYDAKDLKAARYAGSLSNAAFLCWWAGLDTPDMLQHLQRVQSSCDYGVPSCDPQHPSFDAKRYWRGPVWGMMNLMIGEGLAEFGHTDEAARVRADTARLIYDHGFAEYYDPITGLPAAAALHMDRRRMARLRIP